LERSRESLGKRTDVIGRNTDGRGRKALKK